MLLLTRFFILLKSWHYLTFRRSSKRSFGNCESHGQNDLKRFKEDHEHVHPDLIEVKNFLSQMKAHWKTQKMNKDEEG